MSVLKNEANKPRQTLHDQRKTQFIDYGGLLVDPQIFHWGKLVVRGASITFTSKGGLDVQGLQRPS